jgi:hypothetical protein
MANRALRATPSTTEDLQPWQMTLSEKLSQLHRECFEKRTALTDIIQKLLHPRGIDAVAEIAYAAQVAYDLTYDEAHVQAQQILEAGPPDFTGARNVCILSWSVEDESLWRGLSDNNKVIRLARSMVTTGYRQDEPINSRTFDLTAPDGILAGKLLFGDGQARGVAVRLAFNFLVNGVRKAPDGLIGD